MKHGRSEAERFLSKGENREGRERKRERAFGKSIAQENKRKVRQRGKIGETKEGFFFSFMWPASGACLLPPIIRHLVLLPVTVCFFFLLRVG